MAPFAVPEGPEDLLECLYDNISTGGGKREKIEMASGLEMLTAGLYECNQLHYLIRIIKRLQSSL